jgi:hypothetical protein
MKALAQPAQQDHVATLIEHYAFTDGIVRFDGVENMEQLPVGTKFYTTPPAAPVPLADGVLKITMQLDGLEVSRLLSLDVIRTSNAPEVDRHSRQAWLDLQKAAHGITKGQP